MSSSWSWSKVSFVVFICAFMLFFTIDAFTSHYSEKWLDSISTWLGTLNIYVSALIYLILSILVLLFSFPSTVLSFSGGYLFATKAGLGWGWTLSSIFNVLSNVICSTMTFYFSLYYFNDNAEELVRKHKYMKTIQKSLQNRGMFINILLRSAPVLPSGIMNYSLPPLGVKFKDYIVGLTVGVTPYAIVFSVLGACAAVYHKGISDFVTQSSTELLFLYAFLAFMFLFGCSWLIMRYVNATMRELSQDDVTLVDRGLRHNGFGDDDNVGYVPVSHNSPNTSIAADSDSLSIAVDGDGDGGADGGNGGNGGNSGNSRSNSSGNSSGNRQIGSLPDFNQNPLLRGQKDEKKTLLKKEVYEL